MSLVTSAVVLVDTLEDAPVLVELGVRPVSPEGTTVQQFGVIEEMGMTAAGGYKHVQFEVFIGGFNYIHEVQLEKWFYYLPWAYEDEAVLIYKTEQDPFVVKHKRRGPITIS